MMTRLTMLLAIVGITVAPFAQALSWFGNVRMSQSGGNLPARGSFLEAWQPLNIEAQTWPVGPGQRVVAVVTTNDWATSQEHELRWSGNAGNNSLWRLTLGPLAVGTSVQFFLRASQTGGATFWANNNGANFGTYYRHAPRWRRGAILQWFDTDYRTIMARLPEVVEAGYSALYLPAPSKAAGGGFSAGYDPVDRFDLGDRLQKGSVRTRFGTTQELQELIRVARRLGLEVYCDLVVNHNANRSGHPIDRYPDMIPEDFHIRSSADTSNGEVNFNVDGSFSFGMLNRELFGLVDIAQEDGNNVARDGQGNLTTVMPPFATQNAWGKPSFVRHPTTPQYYPGNAPASEDVREYLDRWVKWLAGTVGFDGFRIDAVKHVPPGYFGWAPDQAAAQNFTNGNLVPRLYQAHPNTFVFGEDFTTDSFELNQYAKTGMNLLDFPLNFAMKNVFNSNGLGDLRSLSNDYNSDASTGLFFQQGGLTPDVGVAFVQSHDDGPPESNNLAHAFILGRPGRAKIYYDGNNIQPGNWTNFPRPGRFDALGNGSDRLVRLVEANARFGRGAHVDRWEAQSLYIFERQVNGSGTALIGMNHRSDNVPQTATVSTGFRPGQVLIDLTGQRPPVTVGADRRVTITVPANFSATEPDNGTGYVFYAPDSPGALTGTEPVEVRSGGVALPFATVPTPGGAHATGRSFRAVTVTGDRISLRIRTNALGHSALVRFNHGQSVGGLVPLSSTPEGLADGFVTVTKLGSGSFELSDVDISALPEGLNLIKVRVFADSGTDAGVFTDFNTFVFVRRDISPSIQVDGVLTDLGSPLAVQSRNFTSNNNRIDALYARNDERFLYLGLAGRVATNEDGTNGFGLAIDTDASVNTGVRNLGTLDDDSGPAARLVSNTRLTLPPTMGADYMIGVFRNSALRSSPEAAFPGLPIQPANFGAQASLFRVNASNLRILEPRRALIVSQIRANRTDQPPRGAEIAIPLTELYPGGMGQNPRMQLLGWHGTTGESGNFLAGNDPLRATLGGRPAPVSWVSNQFIPTQLSIFGDPGASFVSLATAANFSPSVGSLLGTVPVSDVVSGPGTQEWLVVIRPGALLPRGASRIAVRVALNPGVTLSEATDRSSVVPNSAFVVVPASLANGRQGVTLRFTAPSASLLPVSAQILNVNGAL